MRSNNRLSKIFLGGDCYFRDIFLGETCATSNAEWYRGSLAQVSPKKNSNLNKRKNALRNNFSRHLYLIAVSV